MVRKKGGREEVSGRNRLAGKISQVKKDTIVAQVNLEVGAFRMTAIITRDALDELGLKVGDTATALIKATEVMIIKDH